MSSRLRRAGALIAAGALLAGCGSDGDPGGTSAPSVTPTAAGALGPGFYDAEAPPAPESAIMPRPGSWDAVHPPEGFRVVLLTAGAERPTRTLVAAVRSWAAQEHVRLQTFVARDRDEDLPRFDEALAAEPDLVVCAGEGLLETSALVTASHLDQQFLVLGGQLAEPTTNVTAADWAGASFRDEGRGSAAYDPASFTGERAARALRAGVAAVLNHLTGIVIRVA